MSRSKVLLCALPSLLAACTDHPLARLEPQPEEQTDKYVPIDVKPKADILFMVDNSGSMKEEQDNLARNFPTFMAELRNIQGGLPDVHVAVVTSDLGAGTLDGSGCHAGGQGGLFQGWDKGCGVDPNSRFIVASDGEKSKNYQGDLAAVFACMAKVGVGGCGYEHQLAAATRALSAPRSPENAGFLRDDAYLQIILITDEDDCSAPSNSDLFGMSLPEEEPSFRCARAGHTCQGRMPPAGEFSAPLADCEPVENGALINVGKFVEEVRALKKDPAQILVAGIFGWPTTDGAQYRVGKAKDAPGRPGQWDYLPVCSSMNGEATAALRVKQFVDAFGANSSWESICSDDFSPVLKKIAKRLADAIEHHNLCIDAPVVDADPAPGLQADCLVSESAPAPGGPAVTYLHPCGSEGNRACWKLEPLARCSGSGLQVVIDRKGERPLPGTQVAIRCRTCVRADDPRCRR
jgi:hypothetical protein